MSNFVGVDELTAMQYIRQNGIGGSGFPSAITTSNDIQPLVHFKMQKYEEKLEWVAFSSIVPKLYCSRGVVQECHPLLGLQSQLQAHLKHGYTVERVVLGHGEGHGEAAIDTHHVVGKTGGDTPHKSEVVNGEAELVHSGHLSIHLGGLGSLFEEIVLGKVPTGKCAEVPVNPLAGQTARDEAHTLEELERQLVLLETLEVVGGSGGKRQPAIDTRVVIADKMDVRHIPFCPHTQAVGLAKGAQQTIA